MRYETLLLEQADGVVTVTINRPEKRNALNTRVRRELVQALDRVREDDAARVVIVTGAGARAFVAGADVREFAGRTAAQQQAAMEERRVFDEVAAFPKPTIAMVNGYALGGGCELALACDLRVAGRSARFGQPEIKLGLLPGGGGTQRLSRLVGPGRAMRMVLTGEMVAAEEAERIGLADLVVADAELPRRTMALARQIAAHSPVAVRMAKEALRAAVELPLAQGLERERELFLEAFASEDATEGIAAFLEKREPRFRGR